ncbi:MAG: hypothetical protein ACLQVL_17570 [Terriglobia bacterium]
MKWHYFVHYLSEEWGTISQAPVLCWVLFWGGFFGGWGIARGVYRKGLHE